MEKHCPHCDLTKPVESFYRSARKQDGRDAYCKACRDGLGAARRAAERASRPVPTPPTHKMCSRCGETKPVMQFYQKKAQCKTCLTELHREYVQQPDVAARILQQERNRASGKWKRPPRRQPVAEGYEVCTMCNLDKPVDEFHVHKLGRSGRDSMCKQCKATMSRTRREDPAVRSREWQLTRERRYGLQPGQYDEILAAQGGTCAICRNSSKDERSFDVDHDHITGEIRGLLCNGCNKGLGSFQDDPAILSAAIDYLARYNRQQEVVPNA